MGKNYIVLEAKVFKNEKVLNDKELRVYIYRAPFKQELTISVAEPQVEPRVFEGYTPKDEVQSLIPHMGDILLLLSSEAKAFNSAYKLSGNMFDALVFLHEKSKNTILILADQTGEVRIEKTAITDDPEFDKIFFDLAYMLLKEHGVDAFISESSKFSNMLSASEEEESEDELVEEPEPRKVTVEEAKEVEKQIESLIEKDYSSESKPDEEKK